METKRGETKKGVVAELDGKYWGEQYNDGHSCQIGFGPIDNAKIVNPEFCPVPEHMTYDKDPQRGALSNATLRKVARTAVFVFED
jgi:hypothetical protein